MDTKLLQEGQAHFQVGAAFYRPSSKLTRDLGVLAASVYRQAQGHLHVLDLMTGCGVRGLRYALEANADQVWVNEGNPNLGPILKQNFEAALPQNRYRLTLESTQQILSTCLSQRQLFDLVDIDGFGSPIAHLPLGLATTRLGGLIYVTATDGKSLSGQHSERALRQFNAYTRWHPAGHEQGLRVVLGTIHQIAQFQQLSIQPIFSFFCGKTYRAMVQLRPKDATSKENYGFLGYCHHCGDYQQIQWRSLNRSTCKHSDSEKPLAISGPLWLGNLHCPTFLESMKSLAMGWGWTTQAAQLERMAAEVNFPPYYYPLAEIGRRGRMDIPKRDRLIKALQDQGYRACLGSISHQSIRTSASLADVIRVSKELQQLKGLETSNRS